MKNKKEKLVPELRFPEFKGEWKNSKLGNIAEFDKGKNISKADISEDGEIECIRYGELYTRYKEIIDEVYSRTNLDKEELVFSEKGDVLTPSSGETAIDIATASCINKDDVALGGDINIIRSDINGNFLAYYLSNKKRTDVARLAQGISVIHLYKSHLKSLSVNLPSKQEQQKISSFLSLIDKKIELLKKKKELLELYKKGVMQKIFNREIRFKDKDGNDYPEWEEKRLGEIVKIRGGYAFKSKNFLTKGVPIIRISNIPNKGRYTNSENLVYYEMAEKLQDYQIRSGEAIIALSGATTGKVGVLRIDQPAFLNQRVGVFMRDNIKVDYDFLIHYVFSQNFQKEINKFLVAGAQPNISISDINTIKTIFPSLREQAEIAGFLNRLLKLTENTQDTMKNMKTFKKGLLQKMFI
jgi:type I restriction enzyme S subunit